MFTIVNVNVTIYAAEMSNMTDLCVSGAIFSTSKYSKTRPRRLRRLDLGAFGASVVSPQHKFLATPMY